MFAHGGELVEALSAFRRSYLAPVLCLSSLNYLLRFVRWHLYLRRCGCSPDPRRSAAVFVSGLSMSVTPGKFGELFKSGLLRESDGVPISVSAPVVVAERVTDLAAVLAIAALGAAYYSVGRMAALGAGVLLAGLVGALAVSPRYALRLGPWLARRRMVAALTAEGAESLQDGSQRQAAAAAVGEPDRPERSGGLARFAGAMATLMRGRVLLIGLGLGVLAWLAECVALYLVLAGLGEHAVSLSAAVFVYALATLAGAVSFLPGGLGATEASMAGLLIGFNVAGATAAAATLIIRACTLWYAVLVGTGGYVVYRLLMRTGAGAPATGPLLESRAVRHAAPQHGGPHA